MEGTATFNGGHGGGWISLMPSAMVEEPSDKKRIEIGRAKFI
jgi:hypothetical protein